MNKPSAIVTLFVSFVLVASSSMVLGADGDSGGSSGGDSGNSSGNNSDGNSGNSDYFEDDDGVMTVVVKKPKRKRDRAWCQSCGTITVTAPPPGLTRFNIEIKADRKGTREDRQKLRECQEILQNIEFASQLVSLTKNIQLNPSSGQTQEQFAASMLKLENRELARREAAMQEWLDSGCSELLGSDIAVGIADAHSTAFQ